MNVENLIKLLEKNSDSTLHIMLPSGEFVPEHFHVTEVGQVRKNFIDCGGTCREEINCVLQIWTAHDVDHRLNAGKLVKILKLADKVIESNELQVWIEYGNDIASQYFISDIEMTPKGILFSLSGKQTDCLAPDKCGISGCC